MKKNFNKSKKGCKTCFTDARNMNEQLGKKKPNDLSFEQAKKIFSPLKNKIITKNS